MVCRKDHRTEWWRAWCGDVRQNNRGEKSLAGWVLDLFRGRPELSTVWAHVELRGGTLTRAAPRRHPCHTACVLAKSIMWLPATAFGTHAPSQSDVSTSNIFLLFCVCFCAQCHAHSKTSRSCIMGAEALLFQPACSAYVTQPQKKQHGLQTLVRQHRASQHGALAIHAHKPKNPHNKPDLHTTQYRLSLSPPRVIL